jgi:hypothetical protein
VRRSQVCTTPSPPAYIRIAACLYNKNSPFDCMKGKASSTANAQAGYAPAEIFSGGEGQHKDTDVRVRSCNIISWSGLERAGGRA